MRYADLGPMYMRWKVPESIIHVVDSASDASAKWPSCVGPAESIGPGIHIRPTEQAESSTAAGLAILPSKATESASQSKSSSLPCVWFATTSAWESSFASSARPELRLLKVSCTRFHTGHSFREEDDAMSAVSELEVQEWLEEQGAGAVERGGGGPLLSLPTPDFTASAETV